MQTLALRWLGIEIDKSRRPVKYTLTALLMAGVMLVSGYACNVQTWVNNVQTILQEVAPAVQIIVSLLPLLGVQVPPKLTTDVGVWVPKVEKDVTDLGNLVTQYQGDLATNATAQAQINALIVTTQNDVLSILPDFGVLDPNSQAKVVDAINVISAAITSVENIINNIEGHVSLKAARGSAQLVKNGKAFKKQFNSTVTKNFGSAAPQLH